MVMVVISVVHRILSRSHGDLVPQQHDKIWEWTGDDARQ